MPRGPAGKEPQGVFGRACGESAPGADCSNAGNALGSFEYGEATQFSPSGAPAGLIVGASFLSSRYRGVWYPTARLVSDDAARAQTHIVDNAAGTFAGRIAPGDSLTTLPTSTGQRKTPVLAVRVSGVCWLCKTRMIRTALTARA